MQVIYQNEVAECGYACLAMVLSHSGRATEVRELSAYRPISANGLSLMDLYDVATDYGLEVQAFRFDASQIGEVKQGSIIHFGGAHFVVFERATRHYVHLIDPAVGRRRIALDTFVACVSGYLIECAPTPALVRIKRRSRVPEALARLRALNPQLRSHAAKILFVAVGAQFAILAQPYFGSFVLDHVVAEDNLSLLNVLALTFGSIFLIGALGQYVQGVLVELLYARVSVSATQGLFAHLLRVPVSYFEKRNVGDIFTRFKAQDEINGFASRSVVSFCVDVTVGVLALLMMFIQDTKLSALVLAIFTAYVLVAALMFASMRDTHARVLQESARCDDALFETVRGASLIKLSQGETRRVARFMELFRTYASALFQSSRLTATREAALKLLAHAETLAVTWLAAKLMLGGALSVGAFYSFMIYKSLFSERIALAINAAFSYSMLSVPVARVDDIVACEPERYTALADVHRTVEVNRFERIAVRAVTFSYGISDQPILTDASLDIVRGDKIVITGPSGVGKSTLFKLLAASETAQRGEITLNGIAWPNLSVDEIRRHATHMRQGDIILHGSIADNISLFEGNPDEARILALLEAVGLLDDVMRLPMRTRTVISDSLANISAGQRQRLLLARALYQPRELLLLDEPTSNLDPVAVRRISALLQQIDRTVVVITHDVAMAEGFDKHYRLVDGAFIRVERQHAEAAMEGCA
ncbi:peptidase domain-containing ABC transporter [Paraburkholderia sp. Ac-20340]|uniref:peptidase domain-containing ABC transporter n=1 Tax=Paraburkholderia sp. Ac-20340 TaxID=2703888 RepID=UPI00197E2E71|nr:peptidase domain-containing ABC transporter [Paraburkholderia sp. Ac-20340]MBN3852986.1 peptidase domain-containing ABC transporter [Paraburkholderia sp. Ac-20340]